MWSTPPQCTGSAFCSANVCGSRNASVCWASSTTIACRPSGVKYMLYGSATGMFGPARLPVSGLIGVRLLPRSLVAYSVRRFQAGTTCWTISPVAMYRITRKVLGSITYTPEPPESGA